MRLNRLTSTRKRPILLGLAALMAAGTGGYCYRRAVERAALARTYRTAEIVPLPGFNVSHGFAINSSGQVTGRMFSNSPAPSSLISHAFLWDNGKAIDLGVAPGFANSTGYGLNDIGQTVGDLETLTPKPKPIPGGLQSSDPVRRGFQTSHAKMTPLPLLPGFTESEASVINDQGQIAGTAFTAGNSYGRGFLYK